MSMAIETETSVPVLRLNGRFDAHSVPEVRSWAERYPGARVMVDMSAVNFVDSAALSLMVQLMKRYRERGGDCYFFGMQNPVRIILELTRLDRALAVFSSREAALSAAGAA